MTTMYLIRHAEAEGNLYRIAQGQHDSRITDWGYRQIAALAERFRGEHIDAVYASDLTRTCVTAGAVAATHGLPIHKCSGLREICVGGWEGKTWGEIARADAENLERFTVRPDLWHEEGAESMETVRDRVMAALARIAEENDGRTVAVFSHGCALRLALGAMEGRALSEIGTSPHGDNTAVSKVEYENGAFRVLYRDDNRHLQALNERVKDLKRPNGVQPGLYFRPLSLPEQAELLTACVRECWTAAGERRPFDGETLLRETAERTVLTAYQEESPAGVLELNDEKDAARKIGWIALYCMDAAHRRQGLGVQLLGQAVLHFRELGRERLRVAAEPENAAALRFFGRYGFAPAGRTADGRTVLEKNLVPGAWTPEKG